MRFPSGITEDDLPARVHRFFRQFFVDVVDVVRGEAHLDYLDELTEKERRLALDLLLLNLTPPRSSILIGLARLGAVDAVPALLGLRAEVDDASRGLEIARCLTSITGDPDHLRGPLVEAMAPGGRATLKEAHFSDIRLLPPGEQLDLLFDLLEDPDSTFVRSLALRELNELEARKQFATTQLPLGAPYFLGRRDDAAFRERLSRAATEERSRWEPVLEG